MPMVHEPLRYAHDEGHTDVCFSADGEKVISVGADGDIRVWPKDDTEDPIHNCIGEWALSVRQKGSHIYVATGNNDIQILSYPEGERDGLLDRFVAPVNHIALAKNTDMIALAAEEMEIKLIDLNRTNKEVVCFTGLSGPCLSVALAPDADLLAASSGDGKLRIWKVEDKFLQKEIDCFEKVNSFSNAKSLCRIDFDPNNGKLLAYPDKNSVIIFDCGEWSQSSVFSSEIVTAVYSIVQFSPCGKYLAAASIEGDIIVWEAATAEILDYGKHPKNVTICGLMWDPLGSGKIVYTDIEGQLGSVTCCLKVIKESVDTEDIDADINEPEAENEVDFGDVQFEDDDEDDENVISVEKLKKQFMGDLEPELQSEIASRRSSPSPRPRTPQTPLQQAFMPSSTPEHLDPRYLCWNEVGVIRSYGSMADDDSATKSIEAEFHDSTFHNSMMLQNYQEYTMGTVSKAALVVANSSQITVIPLNATSKEWILKAEETEEITLVASSENLVCFAMANYMIRVASIYGTQRAILSAPGPIVSMAAYKNLLLVAYHSAGPRKGDQCIGIKMIKFEGTSLESREIGSALGPESTLSWLGFSDIGTPAMMDSLGMLSLYPHSCNTWIPYCDTTKHNKSPADGFFVTAVFESYQAVGGIKCKGTVYPGFVPRPTMCELPLDPPFAEAATEKTQMEMNMFTWSTLQVYNIEKKYKETALKTFALACKNDLDQRALEFMEILSNPQILSLGIKYATKLEKRRLAEKLMDLASKISSSCDDSTPTFINEVSTPDANSIKPPNRRLTLSSTKYHRNRTQTKEATTPDVMDNSQNLDVTPLKETENNTTLDSTVNTQESMFQEEEAKNPFLKSLKKNNVEKAPNPLSLTDKFAGYNYEKETKENKKNSEDGTPASEKRKQTDGAETPTEKPKEKQRRLDKFLFTKRN